MMKAIEVQRSEAGAYSIPGSATVEDWFDVEDAMQEVTHCGRQLCGWGRGESVYRGVDRDGLERFYFVAEECEADSLAGWGCFESESDNADRGCPSGRDRG